MSRRSVVRRFALVGSLVGLVGLGLPGHSTALTVAPRYAAPTGSGSTCSQVAPCGIVEAINHAPANAEVIVESGVYGSPTPIATLLHDANGVLNIHGEAGKPMPVIHSSAGNALEMDNTGTLDDLEVIDSGAGIGMFIFTPHASHLVSVTTHDDSTACSFSPGLSDSLCLATGADSYAARITLDGSATPGTSSYSMGGVTAIAPGSGSYGLSVSGGNNETITFDATNSIIEGGAKDVRSDAAGNGAHTNIVLSHCDYNSYVLVHTGTGMAEITKSATNIHSAPVFVNAAAGNYEEAAGSATIDVGAPDPADTDLAGLPRTLGAAPDIGAYEFPEKPAVSDLKVVETGKHSAKLTIKVNPEGLQTDVALRATAGQMHKSSKSVSAGDGRSSRKVHLKLHGLKRHTPYKIHAVATNGAGHTKSAHAHAHTR